TRNPVNLPPGRARSGTIAKLAEKKIALDETPLIALDQACRTWTAPAEKTACDGGPDVSEKVLPHSLVELEDVFGRWLLIRDRALLPVLAGTILAHRLDSDPVWLLVVAPPGGTKTEPLRALYGSAALYPL